MQLTYLIYEMRQIQPSERDVSFQPLSDWPCRHAHFISLMGCCFAPSFAFPLSLVKSKT